MSFSWKGLLGVGGGTAGAAGGAAGLATASNGATTGGLAGPGDPFAGMHGWNESDMQWERDDLADLPNMLGMQNFGNTCYVNSVIQALYYCKPFRESLLAYSSTLSANADGKLHPHNTTVSPSEPKASGKQQQESDEVTFFDALRRLFSQMVSATVAPPSEKPSMTSTPSSSSYLATGLSRKGSIKPGQSAQKAATSPPSTSAPVPALFAASFMPLVANVASSPAKKAVNACSNVVVQDDDIKTFLTTLKKSNILFDSTAHQDAHELLNFILNRIGEDVVEEVKGQERRESKTGYASPVSVMDVNTGGQTWVHRVFEGVLTNETRCLTCETVTSRDESFLDLSIDIERNSSVTSCLRQFSASEMLCARNKFFCDTCSGLQEAEKRMKVKKLPNVLALHLKRFKYEEAVQKYVKLAYRVVFPLELRLFNTSDDAEDPDKLYELFGIIVHIGVGPHHGHYIAIVKVGMRWFVFDDETINVIDEADICRYFGDTPGAGSAYVLFYQAVELNMQELGLVDTRTERQRAREKMEEQLWEQYQRQAMPSNAAEGAGLKVDTGRLTTLTGAALQASPTPVEPLVGDFKGVSMAPSTSSTSNTSAAFFNRRQNTLPPTPTQSPPPSEPVEAKSSTSWFSSLRSGNSRKAGAGAGANHLAVAGPSAVAGTSPPSSFRPPPPTTDKVEDMETASVSTSSSTKRTNGNVENLKAQPERTPTPSSKVQLGDNLSPPAPTTMPSSAQGSPSKGTKQPHQGATWAPADRPLSKKEQDKIAKHSRRSSMSMSHSLSPLPPPTVPNGTNQASLGIGHPASTEAGSGHAQQASASSVGRHPSMRRPSTADPQLDQNPSARRRSTLSKTFGFGRRADKG